VSEAASPASGPAPTLARGAPTTPARKTPLRDNIEAFAVAVIMAVMLKYFVLEAYQIPTGSMQPTLMGNVETGIFDRVLVDKLSYHFREPERWEVATFKYPLDRSKNFIKRIAGMPGEQLRIAHGDLWTRKDERAPWKILRRPRPVQREMWKQLDWSHADESPTWAGEHQAAASWTFGHRAIEAGGEGRARFVGRAGAVMDVYADGYPRSIQSKVRPGQFSGENAVGDLRVEGLVRAEAGCTAIEVELTEGSRRYVLEIPGPAAPADATLRISVVDTGSEPGSRVARDERGPAYRLPAGKRVSFGAQNLDDELSLDVDGEVVLAIDVELATDQTSAARIGCRGAGAAFTDLQVFRDVYYREGSDESKFAIPEGHYFMLGDNTQNSSDSREWTLYAMEAAIAGVVRVMRGNLRMDPHRGQGGRPQVSDGENPIHLQSERGPTTWFRDEWGELFVLPTADCRRLPNERAPFVPRELMTGRALLVFWPYSMQHGILRLKWVH
jgi:signal peptidase I